MAEETKKPASETTTETTQEVVVTDVPVPEKEVSTPQPEPVPVPDTPEKSAAPAPEESTEAETDKEKDAVAESASFKEESNKVEELPNPEQKALAELKQLVQEALNKHEFTAPPPPPPAKEEEKKPDAETAEPAAAAAPEEEEKKEEPAVAAAETTAAADVPAETPAIAEPVKEEVKKETPPPAPAAVVEEKKETPPPALAAVEEKKEEEKAIPPPAAPAAAESSEKVTEKVAAVVEDDGAKTVEEIKETIVEVTAAAAPPAPAEEPAVPAAAEEEKPTEEPKEEIQPEEVSIWGIPLLADERSDVILLKFLRARDFKVKEAFAMLKSVVAWRKEFKIDELLEEDLSGLGLEKVVYNHGVDKEGHPVCYNAFAAFQDNELYQNTFADKEKMNKFLRWRIQFMEKSIRNLDFSPDGICTFVQVIDLKNSPGLYFFKKELRQATNRALQLLQDNYPEFVAKQVFINVPWWYPAYYRMINALFTTRTKSKFVFAGPSRSAETLFKYIVPEQVPAQYGGLSREGEQEFTTTEAATEDTIKPTSKHTIEFPVTEKITLVWEARVIGWDVSYGAEFVPSAEGGYTIIVEKSRKVAAADETVITNTYTTVEAGKIVLTFDNQTSKRKKLVYRSKTKPSD
ncbi:patellin-3 [Nicotiana tabacum]|uniref:Patellin-3 n=1 Tax=Nicotiana tabacum TaxID=4097 RepID=A0A1S3YLV1_TOBAC|nr:PREDICTED: patellin-3-like [Nicotiana tabacum]